MSSTTDVRKWLREQPDLAGDVPARGPIPADQRARYDQAHAAPGVNAPDLSELAAGDDDAEWDQGGTDDLSAANGAVPVSEGERPPRPVKPPRAGEKIRRRFWQGKQRTGGQGGTKKPRKARVSLVDFIEDTWSDLAWMAAPLPPLQRLLYVQATYAGVVVEQAVKGTIVDAALQPAARSATAIRAVNGVFGPPVFTAAIMARGQRTEQQRPVVDQDGRPVLDPETGEQASMTVLDFDQPTKVMFMGLRYSLLQMTRVADTQLKQVQERAEERRDRGREVDKMIAWIFGMPPPPDDEPASAEEEAIIRAQEMMGGPGGDQA